MSDHFAQSFLFCQRYGNVQRVRRELRQNNGRSSAIICEVLICWASIPHAFGIPHAHRGLWRQAWRRVNTHSYFAQNIVDLHAYGTAAAQYSIVCSAIWTHWDLNPGPSACEADVIPLHHVPSCVGSVFFASVVCFNSCSKSM